MTEADTIKDFVEPTRSRIAAAEDLDEIIAGLRAGGVDQVDCVKVLSAAGLSAREARAAVDHSPVWADHREINRYLTNLFLRAGFLHCVQGGGTVTSPPEDAAEFQDRQTRATTLLTEAAADLPPTASDPTTQPDHDHTAADSDPTDHDDLATQPDHGDLAGFHAALTAGQFGQAFTAMTAIGDRSGRPAAWWQRMARAADALGLDELTAGAPDPTDPDHIRAARLTYSRASAP